MKDKPLNYRQILFVKYYTGDNGTKGNAYQSAIKAGYGESMAMQACKLLVGNCRLKPAIEAEGAKIEAEDVNTRDNVTKSMLKAAAICLKKGDMVGFIRAQENLGKNCGWFAEDNTQRTEQVKLDEALAKDCRKIANIINLDEARKGIA